MALDVEDGSLHDPFGGIADLGRRRLRAVGRGAFLEDPLRVLRLVRFSLLLPGFSSDPSTISLARESASKVPTAAAERRREELARIIRRALAASALDELISVGLFPLLWSGRESVPAKTPALRRSLAFCDELAEVVSDHILDRSLCFHTLVGKSIAEAPAVASQDSGSRQSPIFSDPLGLATKRELRAATQLLEATDGNLALTPRQFLARWGTLWLEASVVAWATAADRNRDTAAAWVERLGRLIESEGQQVLAPRPILDGREVGRILDLSPGPTIGRLLDLLVEAQVSGEIRNREEAMRRLPDLMQKAKR